MKITKREKEVLVKLSEGLTVKEVADVLYVAPSTVVTHKKNIYHKMNARTMVQLGAIAVRTGIIAFFALFMIVPSISQSQLEIDGTIIATDLIGSGNRAVVADDNGLLKVVAQDPAVWELKDSTGDVRFRFDANLGLFQMLVEGDTIRETQAIKVPGIAARGAKAPGLNRVAKVVLTDIEGQTFIEKIHDKLVADKTKIESFFADLGVIVEVPDLFNDTEVFIFKGGEFTFDDSAPARVYEGIVNLLGDIESIEICDVTTNLRVFYDSNGLLERAVFQDEVHERTVELNINSSCEVTRKIVNGDTTFTQLMDPTQGSTLSIDPNSLKLEDDSGSSVELTENIIKIDGPGGMNISNNGGGFIENGNGQNQFYNDLFSNGTGALSVLSPSGFAGIEFLPIIGQVNVFNNLAVNGTISKAAGSFKIDHPLDPTNKWLYHSFVESPDMMNVYNGNVSTDNAGFATVSLPSYFEALNKDFRYQLTVIGTFAQAIIIKTVKDNKFVIQTDQPNVEVSWQVTGIRDDHFARDNRIVAEVHKKRTDAGRKIYDPQRKEPYSKGLKKHLAQRKARLLKK